MYRHSAYLTYVTAITLPASKAWAEDVVWHRHTSRRQARLVIIAGVYAPSMRVFCMPINNHSQSWGDVLVGIAAFLLVNWASTSR
jgi:hypothetical protein